jgi:DNA-binding protein HU-beta
MNKKELSAKVAEKANVTQAVAGECVSATFETIKETLAKGEKVDIAGFGSYEAKTREARMGRNPLTGEQIKIAASVVPSFKASKTFKDYLKENGKNLLKK